MTELTLAPPTTPPVPVTEPAPHRPRIVRWIAIAVTAVAVGALSGLLLDERSTSAGLRDDVAEANAAWHDIASELDATKTDLEATNVALGDASIALAAATKRADDAQADVQRLSDELTSSRAANSAITKENEQLVAERDAAKEAADAATTARTELEAAVRADYIAVLTHGEDALTAEQADCVYDDLVEFAGVNNVLTYEAIFAAGGDLPPDAERAYTHAWFTCV